MYDLLHSFSAYLSNLNYLMLWYTLYAIILFFGIFMNFFYYYVYMFTVHMDPKVVSSSPGTGIQKKFFSSFSPIWSAFHPLKIT